MMRWKTTLRMSEIQWKYSRLRSRDCRGSRIWRRSSEWAFRRRKGCRENAILIIKKEIMKERGSPTGKLVYLRVTSKSNRRLRR
jgi:hypothetical protein